MKCVLCNKKQFTILFAHHKNWKMGKCLSCGLVQVVPMPDATEIAQLYHEDFDHFAPYIEQLPVHHAYFRAKVEEIRWKLPVAGRTKQTLLDIGCAMGVLLEEGKKAGFQTHGIDLSADAVSYCNTHGLRAFTGTVYTVKTLKNASYDVITAFQIIEHERDPVTMMKRVHALLKPGGFVVLATPDYGGFWRKIMGKRWLGFAHPEHVVLFDHETMRQLLEKSGFHDIEVAKDSSRPFPLSFAFRRAADYFPWTAWLLRPIGKLLDRLHVKNPINPWDDMIAFARA